MRTLAHGCIIWSDKGKTMDENSSLILTLDFGTQSVRACIFDKNGNLLAGEKESYEPAYVSPKPGWAEQDPDYYFECLSKAVKRLTSENANLIPYIAGITQTCFRDSAVLLDSNRRPVRPMILWLDQRTAKCKEPLPRSSRFLFALVRKTETIRLNQIRTCANWVKENEPENWEKTDKYVAVATYFLYRLTGELKDCPSDFTGHYPINYSKKAWYPDPMKHFQARIFSVKKEQLCELVPSQSKIGVLTEETGSLLGLPGGIPVYAAGSDKSCETLGTGVVDDSMASISFGTACTIEALTKKYISPFPFLPAYPSVLPDYYNLDLQVYRGYWMLNWFLKEFGATQVKEMMSDELTPNIFNEHLKDVPPGCDGLILQPYWGSELEKPEVRGTIIGFSDMTTRFHVYKAILEGIDYELRFGMERFEKLLHTEFKEIRVSGGGSNSDEVCQIAADILGKKVVKVQTNENSSLGAAISGFLSIGVFKDAKEAVEEMVHPTKEFAPRKEEKAIYDKLYQNVYLKLYPKLKDELKYLYHYSKRD